MKMLEMIDTNFDKVLDSIPLGLMKLRDDYTVIFWNRMLEEWTNISRENIIGKKINTVFPAFSEVQYSVRFQNIFSGGPPAIFSSQLHEPLVPSVLRDGTMRSQHTIVTSIPAENDNNKFDALLSMQDVTELTTQVNDYRKMRDQAEEEVKEREKIEKRLRVNSEELKRSNEELAQFAYVASHDLQEPLRMVSGYLTLIKKRYNDKLDDAGKEFIHFAVDGAERMRNLIQALLSYSRVSSNKRPLEETDLNVVVDNVLRGLKNRIEETDADVKIEKFPVVEVDKVQMEQLFQNLITNALKFQREDTTPQVIVTVKEQDDFWEFAVADNGIGIQPDCESRIFEMFQRLHSSDEFPGAGMGLAICKKIVELHKGKIHATSRHGETDTGTTISFTISKNKKHSNPSLAGTKQRADD